MNHQQHGAMPGTSTPINIATKVYEHPDGFSIAYNAGHLIVIDDMGLESHLPVGGIGLADLGADLIALAADLGEANDHA